MPLPFFLIMMVFGVLYLVFAFVEPPSYLRSFFRVPSIFVFLPDRLVARVGRLAMGLLIIGSMLLLAARTHSFGL